MILIKGQSTYAKLERLVNEINDEIIDWIELLEENSGFKFSITDLGPNVNHETYVNYLLDQISDLIDNDSNIH